jgi:hypothetical protein
MNRRHFILAGIAIAAAAAAVAGGGKSLVLNGKVASNDVRIIDGRPYVPVADVARALGQPVVKRTNGWEIAAAGGANQVEGLRGKVGDTLFDGRWQFQVLSFQEVPQHVMKTKGAADFAVYQAMAELEDGTFRPRDGLSLIVFRCRVKNAVAKANQALWIPNSYTRTALTDNKGQSYPPIAYDIEESSPFQSKELLPGASLDFDVLFTVPKGTVLKDLVFTLQTINDKGKDVRIQVAP